MRCACIILGTMFFVSLSYSEEESLAAKQWNIAATEYNKGDIEKAITEFRELMSDFPESKEAPSALYNIIVCYVRLGDVEKQKETCEKFISSFPDNKRIGEVYFLLGVTYYNAGDYEKAATAFEEIARGYSNIAHRTISSDSYLSHAILNSHYYLRLCYKNLLLAMKSGRKGGQELETGSSVTPIREERKDK